MTANIYHWCARHQRPQPFSYGSTAVSTGFTSVAGLLLCLNLLRGRSYTKKAATAVRSCCCSSTSRKSRLTNIFQLVCSPPPTPNFSTKRVYSGSYQVYSSSWRVVMPWARSSAVRRRNYRDPRQQSAAAVATELSVCADTFLTPRTPSRWTSTAEEVEKQS